MAPTSILSGKRIVVTRALEQSHELVRLLDQMGAEVILLPTVSFAPPEDWQRLDEQLRQLDFFDAILFLSQNAVRYVFDRCAQLGIKCEMLQSSNRFIGAVGPATAKALAEKGLRVDCAAKGSTGEALAHELRGSLSGRRVLLPRSDRGDEHVPNALRRIGADVTEVIAYRTIAPPVTDAGVLEAIRAGKVDAILFSSPSTFHNLAGLLGAENMKRLSEVIAFAAIGPTTANAMRRAGARVEIEAQESSAIGFAASLVKHYQRQSSPARRA